MTTPKRHWEVMLGQSPADTDCAMVVTDRQALGAEWWWWVSDQCPACREGGTWPCAFVWQEECVHMAYRCQHGHDWGTTYERMYAREIGNQTLIEWREGKLDCVGLWPTRPSLVEHHFQLEEERNWLRTLRDWKPESQL